MILFPFYEIYCKSSRELLLYGVRNEAIESSIPARGKEHMGEKNDVIARNYTGRVAKAAKLRA